jgi:Sec-independent protein secretion pathway components
MSALFALATGTAPALAFLEGIGAMEMLLVAVIGLLLFGGKGLPDMARTIGKVVREFKKASASVENEVKRVMNEDLEPAPRSRPRPRSAASPVLPPSPASDAAPGPAATPPLAVPPPPAPPSSETPPEQPSPPRP